MKKIKLFIFFISMLAHPLVWASEDSVDSSHFDPPIQQMIENSTTQSPEISHGRHFWVELQGETNLSFAGFGPELGVGYRFRIFGVDIRGSFGKTNYGGIRSTVDENQGFPPSYPDQIPGQEMNRARFDEDQWSYRMIEPGLSVEGRLFHETFPLLTECARVGFAYGTFDDQANNLSFHSYLFTVETRFIEALAKDSPWSISLALAWKTGNLVLETADENLSTPDRHLPVSWLGTSLGMLYAF